jgi:hypothetical protein
MIITISNRRESSEDPVKGGNIFSVLVSIGILDVEDVLDPAIKINRFPFEVAFEDIFSY